MAKKTKISIALLRLAMGWIFLWAFIDKLWGLGYNTVAERSWIEGVSPTLGFLSNTSGPFADFFQQLAGQGWVDWLFMLGLLGIGLALILGIVVRFASVCGIALLIMMYLASLPLSHNPFIDEHILYVLVLLLLMFEKSGNWIGFGKSWSRTRLVQSMPFFK